MRASANTDPNTTVTSFRIDRRVLDHLKRVAESENRSVSNIIQTLIEDGMGLTTLKLYANSEFVAENIRKTSLQLLENLKQSRTTNPL